MDMNFICFMNSPKFQTALWDDVTYVQAYLPEVHAFMSRKRKRWGSITGYVIAGGYR